MFKIVQDYFSKVTKIDGINYYWNHHWSIRPFVSLSRSMQNKLSKKHIYWHNWVADECTPGFECCNPDLIPEDVKRDKKLKKLGI